MVLDKLSKKYSSSTNKTPICKGTAQFCAGWNTKNKLCVADYSLFEFLQAIYLSLLIQKQLYYLASS